MSDFGALVISLDFELHWGVRDQYPAQGAYTPNLLGERVIIPRLLDLFAEFNIAATWATVGFLFAQSRRELERFSPELRPAYTDPALGPYTEPLGADESEDPLHFAPSLIAAIRASPLQEIGTHTYSHYYCLEPGQTRETFRADLEAALAIARRYDLPLRSIVFPRNQYNADYAEVMASLGLQIYRGNPGVWMYRQAPQRQQTALRRLARLVDHYFNLSGHGLTAWGDLRTSSGLYNIPASRFLRPSSAKFPSLERLRFLRIEAGLRAAAVSRHIYHLWWHPHNFGREPEANFSFLKRLLISYADLRKRYQMRSLNMAGAANLAGLPLA